jgi:esterase/lipase
MKKTIIKFQSAGHTLYGVLEKPEKSRDSLILLLHGLTNSMKDCPLIEESAAALHTKGFPTFRFDYFGSGKSDGEFKNKTFSILYQNTVDSLNLVTQKLHFQKIGLWGRSLGAILGATICDDPHIFASVFISTTIHTHTSFSRLFPENQSCSLPIKGTGKMKGEAILSHKFYEETEWIDSLQKKHLALAKNIFIVQGTKDKTVYDHTWAQEIYRLVKGEKKLEYIEGADHAYKGFEKGVIDQGIRWFNNFT